MKIYINSFVKVATVETDLMLCACFIFVLTNTNDVNAMLACLPIWLGFVAFAATVVVITVYIFENLPHIECIKDEVE
jgi:hypothetical protein